MSESGFFLNNEMSLEVTLPMQFSLLLPQKVVFGWGKRREFGALAAELGATATVVYGSRTLHGSPLWTELMAALEEHGVQVLSQVSIHREPTIEDVDAATAQVLSNSSPVDIVIGIGGGAAIDLAKAVSAMATNEQSESVRDYLEGVGKGLSIENTPLPMLAVPTTAGTGSEATKNAVISVADPPCKKSLRSEKMVPKIVLIDPELSVSVPPRVTAASGMDAITQLIESYISSRATPLTQSLCIEGLKHALPNMKRAYVDGTDQPARTAMGYAAFLSGVSLANSGLGMAHGIAAALGAHCDVPHGLACAALLPIALRTNQTVSRKQQVVLGKLFAKNPHLSKEDAIAASISYIETLCDDLSIPKRLRDLGVCKEQLNDIVTGSRGNSMNGNPRALTHEELNSILEEHW